jgi:hypothetical protein
MGWTVLYIAFGGVALWLLGEVLLQYKARLRWRLLAFVGFLGVVLGVLMPSVPVIGLGAATFAVGQTYVTLSFRRGFAAGWAVKHPKREQESGGRKRRRGEAAHQDPAPEAPGLEPAAPEDGTHGRDEAFDDGHDDVFTPARPVGPLPAETAAEATAVYEPQPLPEDTGSHGLYDGPAYAAAAQAHETGQQQGYGYDGYSYDQQQYGYDGGQQQYAAYSDPYIGTSAHSGGTSYDAGYDAGAYAGQEYGQQGYGQEQQYAADGYAETPPGGVWVPQQRSTDDPLGAELPPEQSYPYQGNGTGYGDQHRF